MTTARPERPGGTAPVLASALGRLPIAMLSPAVLLHVPAVHGSFAVGGAVSTGVLVADPAPVLADGAQARR